MSTNKEEKEEREDNIEHKIANSINITKKIVFCHYTYPAGKKEENWSFGIHSRWKMIRMNFSLLGPYLKNLSETMQ